MSINALTLSPSRHAEPSRRRWTGDEYRRIAELGLFRGQKVELLDGEVFQQHGDREPDRRRWTRDEYQQIAALGVFEGQRIERLDGEIVQHMSPQGAAHAQAVSKSLIALMRVFASGFVVRSQMPLALGLSADPEPDLAVVPGHPDDYDEHPTTALLVLEVSDSSLALDRELKAGLYAAAGIGDYWIVDCRSRRVEVRREPIADQTALHGFRYGSTITLSPGEPIAPLAAPASLIDPSELLPRAR